MTDPGEIIPPMSEQVPQSQNTQHLEIAIEAKTAWGTDHTEPQPRRGTCQKFLRPKVTRQAQEMRSKFTGRNSPQEHWKQSYPAWGNIPREEWVHKFVHTLEPIAQNWYMEAEIRHRIEYQTKKQNQKSSPSNLTVLSPTFPGRIKGQYCAEGVFCHEAQPMIPPKTTNTARLKI